MFALNIQKVPFRHTILLTVAIICWNCAQQGSPSGGARDEDPPVVLECDPPNYSTHFEANKIYITFDEYVVLDNVNQQLIVSPPMEEKPEVKLRKKTIIVQFEELLKDSTTYTFNFGSAIKDLHEGNKLLNYEYVFSTGDILDSLSVKGTLKYAMDLTDPKESMTIMLYNDLRDSVPLTDIPLYVGRSDDSGVFSVNNLRPDLYKVFALKDGNNNLLFDLPTEEIGFLDSSLIVNADLARRLLELKEDSAAMPVDSAGNSNDSLENVGPDLNSIYIDLLMFVEENEIQYITDYARDDPRKIEMMFARPLTDTFSYRFLTESPDNIVSTYEFYNHGRDTLTLWIRDSADYLKDTLLMEVKYTVLDTAFQYVSLIDTLNFSYREKSLKNKKESDEEKEEEKLVVSTLRNNGEQHIYRNLSLNLELPFDRFTDSLISFYHIPDTVEIPEPFELYRDTVLLTRAWIGCQWESASAYRLVLLPGAVNSIYQPRHDTIDITFRTKDIEDYGKILLNLENVNNRVIVQLISKGNVVRKMEVDSDGEYVFSFLMPDDYRIKFIHDLNENGKWDTGKYIEKLQPEPIEFLPAGISVRANWDHDVTMNLEK